MAVSSTRAPMVVTHEGGMRFAAQVRSHRVVVDQPARAGGDDTAPMPVEMMGVALGTCIALYVEQFCRTRGLSTEGMRVEVDQRGATNPNRIGEFGVKVVLPAGMPDQYRPMIERVARSCPVHNTLEHGASAVVEIEAPALAAAT